MDFTDTFDSLERLKDLTEELENKEQDIISSEKLLRAATNDLDIGIWGKGLDGRFVFMNESCAEKILHTTVSDGLAMTDEDFKHDALASACMSSDHIVMETGKTHRFIEYAKYGDGTYLFLDTTKSPWVVDGSIIGTVGSGKNITESVPEHVKEMINKSGSIEIPIDFIYRGSDIQKMIEDE